MLQFDVENQDTSKDVSVNVEGIRNKLTEKNHIYYNENETLYLCCYARRRADTNPDKIRKRNL